MRVIEFLEGFYNRRRRHSSNGYVYRSIMSGGIQRPRSIPTHTSAVVLAAVRSGDNFSDTGGSVVTPRAIYRGAPSALVNGPMEGQISCVKMLKRTMYGRAGFNLLRARALHAE